MDVSTVSELPAQTSSHRETLSALTAQFDTQFAIWRRDGESVVPDGSDGATAVQVAPASDGGFAELVLSAHRTDRVLVWSATDDEQTLAVPLPSDGDVERVAVATLHETTPELLERHAQLVLEATRLREEVAGLNDEVETLVPQVVQSFEELSFIREITHRMALPESARCPAEIAVDILPELQTIAAAEGLVLMLDAERAANETSADRCDRFLWSGDRLLTSESCLKLIETFRAHSVDRPVVRNRLPDLPEGARFPGLREFILVEIMSKGRHGGWLLACNRCYGAGTSPIARQEGFTTVEATLLASAASMLAASFHNLELLRQKEALFTDVVRSLVSALDARDPYTSGHSERVALYARRLAQEISLPRHDRERLYLTGLLHDIGKMAVPDSLLAKPGPLSDDEFAVIAQHPHSGWGILQDVEALQYLLPGVLHHHERYDGKGYPDQLTGDAIPLDGRLVAVCDAYDAMTSDRPYRHGMPQEKAEAILRKGAGADWDPQLIAAFLSAMPDIIAIREQYCSRVSTERKLPSGGQPQ